MMNSQAIYLQALGLICALGAEPREISRRLAEGFGESLTYTDVFSPGRVLPLGVVNTPLPNVDHLPAHEQSRSNQLLLAALEQLTPSLDSLAAGIDPLRIGVAVGASTSGIREGEAAMAEWQRAGKFPDAFGYRLQEMAAPAECLARWLGARGPAVTISTACSSGAKALACARRWLRAGLCDLVIAGGVDSLCGLTVNGFSALESVSDSVCNPFSLRRRGINIGEGAALFAMSREPGPVALRGVGETSDAHHISAPAPDGAGARAAMAQALADAGVAPGRVDYVNLHGTATVQNDKMESYAVGEVLGEQVPCSSTKPYTGHTLGAAGAIEAGFCWLTLFQDGEIGLPLHRWDGERDPDLTALDLITGPRRVASPRFALSNSFAFGGNNISLLLERV